MKTFQFFLKLAGIMLAAVLIGCASSENATKKENKDNCGGTTELQVDNPSITLADYLRRVSGVRVFGNGPSASILIRGTETVTSSSDPLFVLDGIKVGRSFSRVNSLVNMSEVEKIRILKGIEASVSYGMEGGNGVIEIITKESE